MPADVTRRGVLAAAALPVIPCAVLRTPGDGPAAGHPDAAFLDLFRAWVATESRFDDPDLSHAEAERACAESARLVHLAAAVPVSTADGLACKVYLMFHALHGAPADGASTAVGMPEREHPEGIDEAMEHGLFADALRLASPLMKNLLSNPIGSS